MEDVYCLCRGPDDGSVMLCCDMCDEWFHCRCVQIDPEKAGNIEHYTCPTCTTKCEEIKIKKQIRLLECEVDEIQYQFSSLEAQETKLRETLTDINRKRKRVVTN